MSKELPSPSNDNKSEEIDLIVFFNLIGKALDRVVNFFKSIFLGTFSVIMSILKDLFINIKWISMVLVGAVIMGFVIDKFKDKVYYSEMFVIPHFDTKYELINNVDYYNSLIEIGDVEELSKRFNLNKEEVLSLLEFEIERGPESKNDQIDQFSQFVKTLDSVTALTVNFKDFVENRNIHNAKIFKLRVRSKDYKIFKKLENGLNNSLENQYSEEKKQKRDNVLKIEKVRLEKSVKEIQAMKATYLSILETESKKNTLSSGLDNVLGMQVEKTETKEDQLLTQEIELLNQLSNIEKELILEDRLFDTVGPFKEKGLLESIWYKKYKIILPLLALLFLVIFYNGIKLYKYTLQYT